MKKFFVFLLKSALLAGACSLALFLLSPVLTPKWVEGHANNGGTYMTTTTQGYLSLEDNTVDVLFLGSSQVMRDISTQTLTEDYNLPSYTRATTVQAPSVSLYYLEDFLKRQSPQVVLGDFSALYTDYDPDYREPYVRYAFDWMPLSLHKLQAVRDTLKTSEKQSLLDYAIPGLYYHGRWTELSSYDIIYLLERDRTDPQRGAILLDQTAPQDFSPLEGKKTEPAEYTGSLSDYQSILDLCRKKGIPFIMLRLPRVGWTEAQHAADAALAEKNGVPLLDFNLRSLYEEVGLNAETDFYDAGHLNRSGAGKLTAWLGSYLTEQGFSQLSQ